MSRGTAVAIAGLMVGAAVAMVATSVGGIGEATAVLMPIAVLLVLSGAGAAVAMVWARGRQ